MFTTRPDHRLRPVLLAVGLLAGLGLTACSDDSGAGPEPSSSPSSPVASPSASAAASPDPSAPGPADVKPPTAPKAAPTTKGAEAFVAYYNDVLNYSSATMDHALLDSISAPGSPLTGRVAADLDAQKAAGLHYENFEVRIANITVPTVADLDAVVAEATFEQANGGLVGPGRTPQPIRGVPTTPAAVKLTWSDGKWLFVSLDQRAP